MAADLIPSTIRRGLRGVRAYNLAVMSRVSIALFASLLSAGSLLASDAEVQSVAAKNAWARPTPPNATSAAVYVELQNTSGVDDRLIALSSPVAEAAEVHQSREAAGVASMAQLPFLLLPAKAVTKLTSGATHIMLVGLKRRLAASETFQIDLAFDHSLPLTLQVKVAAEP